MSTENEKRLDDLFKKKLEDPVDEIRYEEGDWHDLEKMLDKKDKRGAIVYLLPVLSAIAAMLLLFLGWWAFRPKIGTQPVRNQQQANVRHKTIKRASDNQAKYGSSTDTITNHKASLQPLPQAQKVSSPAAYSTKNYTKTYASGLLPGKANPMNAVATNGTEQSNNTDAELIAINPAPVFGARLVERPSIKQLVIAVPAYNVISGNPAVKKGIAIKPKAGYRPQYALSVIAAPDINGVGSFSQGKVGTNIGLTFTAGVSKKFTISTGALYSVKPYLTNFSNYNTGSAYKWPVNPINVTADCRMLDIPLNVGYLVYHKQQNKLSVGTGLSSYLMLHENYQFTYDYSGPAGPASYTVAHPGKYFFGVVNLNATYERQLNSKVGLSIQPYLKLPLSNVGYSQVKLQTTGVAVGLSWNLNSLAKP